MLCCPVVGFSMQANELKVGESVVLKFGYCVFHYCVPSKMRQIKLWWVPVAWWETSNRNSTPGHPLIGPSWDLFSQPWVFQGLAVGHTQKDYWNMIISGSLYYVKCWLLECRNLKMSCFSYILHLNILTSTLEYLIILNLCTWSSGCSYWFRIYYVLPVPWRSIQL